MSQTTLHTRQKKEEKWGKYIGIAVIIISCNIIFSKMKGTI